MTLIRMTMTCLAETRCHPRASVLSVRLVGLQLRALQLRVLDLQTQFVETSDGDFLALKVTKIQ